MEYEWSKLREIQLNQEMDAIASSTTQAISERKADERLAAECLKKTQQYKASKAKVIADRAQRIYDIGNGQ